MHNYSMSKRVDIGGSTYDSFHGWVIWGTIIKDGYYYDGNFLETTRDGRLFEPFPHPPENITYSTGDAGEGSELGLVTASPDVTVAFPDFSMIPIMPPGKGGKFEFQFW